MKRRIIIKQALARLPKREIAFIVVAVLVVVGVVLSDQTSPLELEWENTFGGADDDKGYSVEQTSDGGYIVVGETRSYGAGECDTWLIKTDSSGNGTWNKTFGGEEYDRGRSVKQTSDGGYIIAGETESYGAGSYDIWLIKTDSSGNKVWDNTLGGAGWEWGYSVEQTTDGGYIINGITTSYGAGGYDVWLVKTDSSGNETWNKTFGGEKADWCDSAALTSDGGYIISGFTRSYGAGRRDVWLIKTDSSGSEMWNKTFGSEEGLERGHSVQQTSDGGYIIAGEIESSAVGAYDVWLIKTDSSGSRVWENTFGGTLGGKGHSVQQTSDGGYIITGEAYSRGGTDCNIGIMKTDSGGNKEWDKAFDGGSVDWGTSIRQTSDGGYIVVGTTEYYGAGLYDICLIKIGAG